MTVAGVLVVISFPLAQVSGMKAKDPALRAAIDGRQKAIDTRNAAEWGGENTADDFVNKFGWAGLFSNARAGGCAQLVAVARPPLRPPEVRRREMC
jgi:hypothetical protein